MSEKIVKDIVKTISREAVKQLATVDLDITIPQIKKEIWLGQYKITITIH